MFCNHTDHASVLSKSKLSITSRYPAGVHIQTRTTHLSRVPTVRRRQSVVVGHDQYADSSRDPQNCTGSRLDIAVANSFWSSGLPPSCSASLAQCQSRMLRKLLEHLPLKLGSSSSRVCEGVQGERLLQGQAGLCSHTLGTPGPVCLQVQSLIQLQATGIVCCRQLWPLLIHSLSSMPTM